MSFIDYLNKNSDAIILGIIASTLTIMLQISVYTVSNFITYFITLRWYLRRLFSFADKENIYIISGSIYDEATGGTTLISGPSASAAANLHRTLEDIYSDSKIKHMYSTNNQSFYIDENIVSVGGPVYNSCTKNLMKHTKSLVYFDENDALHFNDHVYKKSVEDEVDYGLIIRLKNPFDTTKKALIIAGCGSHGVLAASMLFNKSNKFKEIQKDFEKKIGFINHIFNKDFIAVIQCRMNGNDISEVTFIEVIKLINGSQKIIKKE